MIGRENPTIIASMTTIPSRIEHIAPVIQAALNQTIPVNKLEINIPLVFSRTGEEYIIPEYLYNIPNVSIVRTEDFGAITKIAPTLIRYNSDKSTYIWSIDDDCAFPPNQLELLLKPFNPNRPAILTRYGGALNSGFDYQNWFGERRVSFFEAFGGVLYPPGSIEADFEEYVRITSENEDCRRSDDIVLSMYFNMKKIPMYLYNCPDDEHPYMVSGWLQHSQTDAISTGGHLEKYGRVFKFVSELLESQAFLRQAAESSMRTDKKLELGCGMAPTAGYEHHDRSRHSSHVDIVHDLNALPWPWADESCSEILALDVFEHLQPMPEHWLRECHRILAPGGVLHLRVPIFGSPWHVIDPTHVRGFHPLNFDFFIHGRPYWLKNGHYYFDFSFREGEVWTEEHNIVAKLTK